MASKSVATTEVTPSSATSSKQELDQIICRGNCLIEGLDGTVHALIMGIESGDLGINLTILIRALYGVLYQIEAINETFESAEIKLADVA